MEFFDNDKIKPEHSSVMVMPAKRKDGRWDLFIILSGKSINRIMEYDPAELLLDKMPKELTAEWPAPERIFVAYATYEEMKGILQAYEDGKGIHKALMCLLRGRKNRPEMGDGLPDVVTRHLKSALGKFEEDTTTKNMARIDVQSVCAASAPVKVEAIKHMMIQAWASGKKAVKRLDEMSNAGKCDMDEQLGEHLNTMAKMIGFTCMVCGIQPTGILDSDVMLEEIDPDDDNEGKDKDE